MPEIRVEIREQASSYPIVLEEGLKNEIGQLLTEWYHGDKILLVTDQNVYQFYGPEMIESLNTAGYKVHKLVLRPGEQAKEYQYLQQGYDLLAGEGFNRDNLVVALGGGVVGDLAGMLAATYMRGIPLIQVPTSLLAQVDSSVGGKTAINHARGKNLIGSFYQPLLVVIDPDFLKTLPVRELRTGMSEVIKYGLIADQVFAGYLHDHRQQVFDLDAETLLRIIERSCSIKADIVSRDVREQGQRALLNFGHTIGHALESVTGYQRYNHGEAVAIGMVGAGRLSARLGLFRQGEETQLEKLIRAYDLPTRCIYGEEPEKVFSALFYDKKVQKGQLRWILLSGIGQPLIRSGVDHQVIREVLEEIM